MTNNKDFIQHLSVLAEHVISQKDAVMEAVNDMQQKVAKLPSMEKYITELIKDVQVIKAAVTDTGKQIQNHERRITTLESA